MTNASQKAATRKRMAETGENYTTARRKCFEERARREAAETEVTPENAQRLFSEGRITVNQAREAYGLPPFEPAGGQDVGSFRVAPAVPARDDPLEAAFASRVEFLGDLCRDAAEAARDGA
jgi:hypothetical protein